MMVGFWIVLGGNIPYLGMGLFNGLWWILIEGFLTTAATQSYEQLVAADLPGNLSITQATERLWSMLGASGPAPTQLHQRGTERDGHSFPVTEGDRVVGRVTLDDVRAVPRSDWGRTLVREIMTPAQEGSIARASLQVGRVAQ